MLSCRRLSKSAIQNTSALTFISKIESKLDGLKVFFIHNLLPSFECPACYCSVQTAIAINHAVIDETVTFSTLNLTVLTQRFITGMYRENRTE